MLFIFFCSRISTHFYLLIIPNDKMTSPSYITLRRSGTIGSFRRKSLRTRMSSCVRIFKCRCNSKIVLATFVALLCITTTTLIYSNYSYNKYLMTLQEELNEEENTYINTTIINPRFPFISQSVDDHIYFLTFDGKYVYTNQDTTRGQTIRRPLRSESRMFKQMRRDATSYLKQQKSKQYRHTNCNNIRYRYIPVVGLEYDVTCSSSETQQTDRVTFRQTFQSPEVTFYQHHGPTNRSKINLILPLMGRPDTFKIFLENIHRVLADGEVEIGLTVVYFDDMYTSTNQELLRMAKDTDKRLETQFILLESQPFSRSKGILVGVNDTQINADIIFLCDVDIFFDKQFVQRCHNTPVKGYQIYFPVIFSLFNPEFIYTLKGKPMPALLNTLSIGDEHGYWRVWGHGMACVHKFDFIKIGGFNVNRTGWGGEDITFLHMAHKRKYKIIRALEPNLFHQYHRKTCDDAGKGQRVACRKVQAMSEASRVSFGLWYYKLALNFSFAGLLDDGIQPYHSETLLDSLMTESPRVSSSVYFLLSLSLIFNVFLSCYVCNTSLQRR